MGHRWEDKLDLLSSSLSTGPLVCSLPEADRFERFGDDESEMDEFDFDSRKDSDEMT